MPRLHRSSARHRAVRATVAACAGLCLVAATALAAPSDADQVIVPAASPAKPPTSPGAPGAGAFTVATIVLLAGAGAWLLWRGRGRGLPSFGRTEKQLNIEETRSLGGRQYLVVASYRDQKFLLGVCAGRIDLLASLNGSNPPSVHPPQS